jgi:actin related protein 2/3 complex subunit 2
VYRRAGQEFMEARRSAGLSTAPPCLWSPSPPLELKGAPAHALDANSGFVSFASIRSAQSAGEVS